MREIDEQTLTWMDTFGRRYTDRNALTLPEMEDLYRRNYGFTRTELNQDILRDISRSATILEVGANIGNQVLCLQKMGFTRLYGIELQGYALRVARSRTREVPLVQASAFRIPFRDGAFDMLFTSGLLIHVHPSRLEAVVSEIHRCARRYIWGFEYYADEYTEIPYRGRRNLLWKADYVRLYRGLFDDLEVIKERRLPYLTGDKEDAVFLLEKV